MGISDWRDVCSSDLVVLLPPGEGGAQRRMREGANRSHASLPSENARPHPPFGHLLPEGEGQKRPAMPALSSSCEPTISRRAYRGDPPTPPARSFAPAQIGRASCRESTYRSQRARSYHNKTKKKK